MESKQDIYIQGIPISPGIGIGTPIFLETDQEELPDFPITVGEVDHEIARYHKARCSSRADLKTLQENLESKGSNLIASIIETHIEMLDDPLMTTNMEQKIRETLKNPESVFHTVIQDYERKFSEMTDSFFKQRLSDVRDLSQRILRNLCDLPKLSLDEAPQDAILFSDELSPSDIASMESSQIGAFVTEMGGGTSHAALIARAKGIPYVSNVDIEMLKSFDSSSVIVNGQTGEVILNPSIPVIGKYMQLKNTQMRHYHHLEKEKDLKAETLDGFDVEIYANINDVEDLTLAIRNAAMGVGLFRSEYLFLDNPGLFFDELKQVEVYKHLFSFAKEFPVTFRVMDLGGDKCAECFQETSKIESSPFGQRGIRFLLGRPDLLITQLRAVLQAAVGKQVRILLPVITEVEELRDVQIVLQQVKNELHSQGILFLEDPLIGCMLEVPTAVLVCDALAKECDFLALGTNDLAQYTLGVDRSDSDGGMLSPAMLRMIRLTLLACRQNSKSMTICGDFASNSLYIPLLVGLGAHISCDPRVIPVLKQNIRRLSFIHAVDIAEQALTLETAEEIRSYLAEEMKKLEGIDEDFPLIF